MIFLYNQLVVFVYVRLLGLSARDLLKSFLRKDLTVILISVLVQIPLAIFLGHFADERSFMDTGYLVSAGLNPYQHYQITVFSPYIVGINTIIGDPPLYPLLLGLIYHLTFNFTQNIFLYNFAIKIPVIASNIGLALLTKKILEQQNTSKSIIRFAWLFLLFNPFLLLTSSAWGQFDTLVALLCIASLYLLSKGMVIKSAALLSLGIVLKPVLFPLVGLPILFSTGRKKSNVVKYIAVSAIVIVSFWILPFYILGWAIPSSIQGTSFFNRAGGLSTFTLVELLTNKVTLPSSLQLLGYLWVPALLIGYYLVYRNQPKTYVELTQKAAALMSIFFLTFSWVSEPYINVLIALILVSSPAGKTDFRSFHFLWVLPLIFMVITTNFAQLFFLVYPSVTSVLSQIDQQIRVWRLIARFIVVLIWQVCAWRLAIELFRPKLSANNKQLPLMTTGVRNENA